MPWMRTNMKFRFTEKDFEAVEFECEHYGNAIRTEDLVPLVNSLLEAHEMTLPIVYKFNCALHWMERGRNFTSKQKIKKALLYGIESIEDGK